MAVLVYLALLAVLWVTHVIRQVRREKRRTAGLAPATDAYEGNLVIPPPGTDRSRHAHGVLSHSGPGGPGGHSNHAGHWHSAHGHGGGMGHDAPGGHH